jgi:hypothetical protein
MRIKVQGQRITFIDSELSKREERQADLGDPEKEREEVCDNWGPSNRQPASDREMLEWSPEQYRLWIETGRKPVSQDEQAEPNSRQKQIAQSEHFAAVSDARHGYRGALTADELRGLSPSERFAAASDRMHGNRGALPAEALAGLSSSEQYAARSAHRWASWDPGGRIEALRRRRSD